ncbi:MAG: hypothetical protein IPK78_04290 [Rhodospirillales bacterium]|nr:hypothetical protein [Rhodospirillales bacterium]
MKRRLSAATFAAVVACPSPAHAGGMPVVDAAANVSLAAQLAEDVKATADRAMDYAQQVATYVELVNTYATAVQNTVAIPMDAINRVTNLYVRTQTLATQAAAIAGPDGSMMQRLRMVRSVGAQGGALPGGVKADAKFWNTQRERQMDENARLLGLENERRLTMDDILGSAQTSSATSIGQMQAIQAQSQVVAASAMQLQAMNDQLAMMQQYQVENDATEAAKDRLYRDWLAGSGLPPMFSGPGF